MIFFILECGNAPINGGDYVIFWSFLFYCTSLKCSDYWAFCLDLCVYCLLILHTDICIEANQDHWDHTQQVLKSSHCHYHKIQLSNL